MRRGGVIVSVSWGYMFKKMLLAATVAAVVAAPIQAACWKADEASAAGVRELQSMLMVAALRCQVAGHPMMNDYNDFVSSNRAAIGAMNDRIKAHFIRTFGPAGGQRAYDSFTTSMANGYGAASSGAEVCADADSLAREGAGMGGSIEGLKLLAERQGLTARLPEGLCEGVARTDYASASGAPETARR
jgi:hypothetical protein